MYSSELINIMVYGGAILFTVFCLVFGAMLYMMYDKLTRVIVAAVEMHAMDIKSKILSESDMIYQSQLQEWSIILSEIKHIKRLIPNVISHLCDIEKSKLFGARLKSWRHKLQLTQKDVYHKTGICVGRISDIERGINPSEDERGILSRMMDKEEVHHGPEKLDIVITKLNNSDHKDGALEFEKKENELEV